MTNKDAGKIAIAESLRLHVMEILKDKLVEDSERFADILEELDDSYGFLGDDRMNYMEDLDDYLYGCGACEIINRCQNVDTNDEYFYEDSWGDIYSTDERNYEDYENMDTVQEIVDNADSLKDLFSDDELACIEVIEMLDSFMQEIRAKDNVLNQATETVDDATTVTFC